MAYKDTEPKILLIICKFSCFNCMQERAVLDVVIIAYVEYENVIYIAQTKNVAPLGTCS